MEKETKNLPISGITPSLERDYREIGLALRRRVFVKDRRFRLHTYRTCFVASEAVDSILEAGYATRREEAVEICRVLESSHRLFQHVTGDHTFKDEYLFFRFAANVEEPAKDPAMTTLIGVQSPSQRSDPDGILFAEASLIRPQQQLDTMKSNAMAAAVVEKKKRDDVVEVAVNAMQSKIEQSVQNVNKPFRAATITPDDMRCLALVAHNHMKPAMKTFIEKHSEVLKHFRLVGTNTTMSMCRAVFGDDNPDVVYGPPFTSGPLGGDAQLAALMALEDVGGIIFFMDPLSAHPHQADIDSLIRLSNVHNVMLCPNPTTAVAMMYLLRQSLESGTREMFPSFFHTLESPAVADYKAQQKIALETVVRTPRENEDATKMGESATATEEMPEGQ